MIMLFADIDEIIDCTPSEKPQTNADRIRAMSDEELASVIMCPYQFDGELDCKEHNCFQCSLKWLQQPAEGE